MLWQGERGGVKKRIILWRLSDGRLRRAGFGLENIDVFVITKFRQNSSGLLKIKHGLLNIHVRKD